MELKVKDITIPEAPSFNYEELKEGLMEKASLYASMVYTDEQIRDAKADRANLNRLKKALNDERIRREKEYMQPFNDFKAKITEIIGIIDKPITVIDKQIKSFEERQKAEKFESIKAYWNECRLDIFDEDDLMKIFNEKWLNTSVSMKTIQEAIDAKMKQITNDLAVIRSLPSYPFEAEQTYIHTLDLAKAVSESHRLQEQAEKKAAWEAEHAEQIAAANARAEKIKNDSNSNLLVELEEINQKYEPVRQWVGFQAFLSIDEAKALGRYLRINGIKYKSI